jgi:hypothetical protein
LGLRWFAHRIHAYFGSRGRPRFSILGHEEETVADSYGSGFPVHTHLGVLAQRGRGLLRQAHQVALNRGVFLSVVDLQAAINRFVVEHNAEPKPFTWTAEPGKIIQAVRRGHQVLDSIH